MGAFCVFEVTVGALTPALGIMRANIIPASIQSTMMPAYRLPLNAVVVIGTNLGNHYGWMAVCTLNASGFAVALLLHILGSRRGMPRAMVAKAAAKARRTP